MKMIFYNLKIALRSILRRKLNTFIIVFSLTVGLAGITIISAFVYYELSADSYHPHSDRIYRLLTDDPFKRFESGISVIRGRTPPKMKEIYPEVEDYCMFRTENVPRINTGTEAFFGEFEVYEATPSFFEFFSFPFIDGSPEYALDDPGTVVITNDLAMRVFGSTQVAGRDIELEYAGFMSGDTSITYIVSGVVGREIYASHLNFDIITRMDDIPHQLTAYLKLTGDADPVLLEQKFSDNRKELVSLAGEDGIHYLQPLQEIYFDTTRKGGFDSGRRDKTFVYVFFISAILILSIATFNFFNLLRSNFAERTREMVMRQIHGSSPGQAAHVFVAEAFILLVVSFYLAVNVVRFLLPWFNSVTASNIPLELLFSWELSLIYISIVALLILISWWFLSRLAGSATSVRYIWNTLPVKSGAPHMKWVTVIQFFVSSLLIILSAVVILQVNYIKTRDIGFSRDIVEIKMPRPLRERAVTLRDELLKNPSVNMASVTTGSPLNPMWIIQYQYETGNDTVSYEVNIFNGDHQYGNILDMNLLEGRFFRIGEAGENRCVVNLSLVRKLELDDPVGRFLPGDSARTIIGVVDDFHFASLEERVSPALIVYSESGSNILVEFDERRYAEGMEFMRRTWENFAEEYPLHYESLDERFESMHREFTRQMEIILFFAFISVVITLSGLYAYTSNSVKKRTRETGIRKVFGATAGNILSMMIWDYSRSVIVGFIVASVPAFYLARSWLGNFAYSIDLTLEIFLAGGAISLVVALATVMWQSLSAARKNPADSLRHE